VEKNEGTSINYLSVIIPLHKEASLNTVSQFHQHLVKIKSDVPHDSTTAFQGTQESSLQKGDHIDYRGAASRENYAYGALQQDLVRAGKPTLWLSLDFEEHQRFFSSQLALVQRLDLEFGRKPGFVFIDEIQRKENAGLFLITQGCDS